MHQTPLLSLLENKTVTTLNGQTIPKEIIEKIFSIVNKYLNDIRLGLSINLEDYQKMLCNIVSELEKYEDPSLIEEVAFVKKFVRTGLNDYFTSYEVAKIDVNESLSCVLEVPFFYAYFNLN